MFFLGYCFSFLPANSHVRRFILRCLYTAVTSAFLTNSLIYYDYFGFTVGYNIAQLAIFSSHYRLTTITVCEHRKLELPTGFCNQCCLDTINDNMTVTNRKKTPPRHPLHAKTGHNQHQAAGALTCARRCSDVASMVSTCRRIGPVIENMALSTKPKVRTISLRRQAEPRPQASCMENFAKFGRYDTIRDAILTCAQKPT